MRVPVAIEEIEMHGDYAPVDGICARCLRCAHEVEVFGTSARSVRRALVMLREECPAEESNFYVADEAEE